MRREFEREFERLYVPLGMYALPARCREVFLLSKRDGLSNEEIAGRLRISVKTVKNQMTKAYARLRDALDVRHRPFFLPFL